MKMTNGRRLSWALNIVSVLLCLASSGLDGVYLSAFMPLCWEWLGLAMNTAADVASQLLMTAWGLLRQGRKGSKKYRLAVLIIPVEVLAVGFSWFLSWRQLLIVMPEIEGAATSWVSAVVAGFVPLLLAGIGIAQSLLYEKDEPLVAAKQNGGAAQVKAVAAKRSDKAAPEQFACKKCGKGFASQQALNGHWRWCKKKQAIETIHIKEG